MSHVRDAREVWQTRLRGDNHLDGRGSLAPVPSPRDPLLGEIVRRLIDAYLQPDPIRIEETLAWVKKSRKDLWRAESVLTIDPHDTEDCLFH